MRWPRRFSFSEDGMELRISPTFGLSISRLRNGLSSRPTPPKMVGPRLDPATRWPWIKVCFVLMLVAVLISLSFGRKRAYGVWNSSHSFRRTASDLHAGPLHRQLNANSAKYQIWLLSVRPKLYQMDAHHWRHGRYGRTETHIRPSASTVKFRLNSFPFACNREASFSLIHCFKKKSGWGGGPTYGLILSNCVFIFPGSPTQFLCVDFNPHPLWVCSCRFAIFSLPWNNLVPTGVRHGKTGIVRFRRSSSSVL